MKKVKWVVVPIKFSEFCHKNMPKYLSLNDKFEPYLESNAHHAYMFDTKDIADSFLADAKLEFPNMKDTLDKLHVERVEVDSK